MNQEAIKVSLLGVLALLGTDIWGKKLIQFAVNSLNYKIGSCVTVVTVTHQELHVKTEGKAQFFWNVKLLGEKQCRNIPASPGWLWAGSWPWLPFHLVQKEVWEGCEGDLCSEEPQSTDQGHSCSHLELHTCGSALGAGIAWPCSWGWALRAPRVWLAQEILQSCAKYCWDVLKQHRSLENGLFRLTLSYVIFQ